MHDILLTQFTIRSTISAALGVAEVIKKRGRDFSIAGVEFNSDEENEEPKVADKLVINNNTNINKILQKR